MVNWQFMYLIICFVSFLHSNKKVVYCLNWSKEDMSAAASREVPMTKQIIDCLAALGEANNCLLALPGKVLLVVIILLTAIMSNTLC